MALLEQLISSGRIVDIALAVLVIEAIAVELIRRRSGAGVRTIPLLVNMGAGGSLMLALRAALTAAGWAWIAFFLVLSLLFHLADLKLRWRRNAMADGDAPG